MLQHSNEHKEDLSRKLGIFSSPLASPYADTGEGQSDTVSSCDVSHTSYAQFMRYTEPTLLEIFYDLYFAATYVVFSDTLQVTDEQKFKASVGYFCLLWLTWFEVALFDVRYVTDCIFARVTRAIQLGVLVGFVVVAPTFSPSDVSDQGHETMRNMSLILCVSRACLAIEYASTLWHVRRYKTAMLPLCLQIGTHVIAASVFLGITFAFHEEGRSRAYMTWYFISGTEAVASILISNFYSTASLTDTHIMKRLTLLTLMIMGEGLEQEAKEVVTIVRNPSAWDGTTIGLVTSAVATIYIVFLVYFDLLGSKMNLPPLRQQLWIFLHLPFHLALVLFMQGFTQCLIWSKIVNQVNRLSSIADPSDDAQDATSANVRDSLNASVQNFFKDYPPQIATTQETVHHALNNITMLPDQVWPYFADGWQTLDLNKVPLDLQQSVTTVLSVVTTLVVSMMNALFAAFGINVDEQQDPVAPKDIKDGGYQLLVQDKTWNRYALVFAYGYISTGCTMLLLSLLTLTSRVFSLTTWAIAQLVMISILAIGTALVSILWLSEKGLIAFLLSPWVMPTITLVWVLILVVIHIHADGFFHCRKRPNWRTTRVEDAGTVSSASREPKQRHSGYEVKRPRDAPG
ncbi:hypothetical protein E4U55_001261 [Claviceps digitariae]|nr:hypothetical protein E4U55_001261 [Claviceps digitariae]